MKKKSVQGGDPPCKPPRRWSIVAALRAGAPKLIKFRSGQDTLKCGSQRPHGVFACMATRQHPSTSSFQPLHGKDSQPSGEHQACEIRRQHCSELWPEDSTSVPGHKLLSRHATRLVCWAEPPDVSPKIIGDNLHHLLQWGQEEPPHLHQGVKVPTLKDPKILAVTFNPMLSFKHHIKVLKQKVRSTSEPTSSRHLQAVPGDVRKKC